MPRARHVGEAAPAVGNFLVLGERVGDQREQAQIFLEGLGQRLGRRLAGPLLRALEQVERLLDADGLTGNLEAQADHGLVEQPVERGIAGHRLFLEQLLDAVFELVRLVAADVLEPGPVMAERRIGHRLVEQRVFDAVELEREEQQMQIGRGEAFLHVAVEFGQHGVGGVAGMEQTRVGAQPSSHIVDLLIPPHRLDEAAAGRERFKVALVGLLEGDAFGLGPFDVALELGRFDAGIEIGQVPFRQRAERLGGALAGGRPARRRLGRGRGHEAVRVRVDNSKIERRARTATPTRQIFPTVTIWTLMPARRDAARNG